MILATLIEMTDSFCKEFLNDEYAELCRKLATALARKRPSPLLQGKLETWACGVVALLYARLPAARRQSYRVEWQGKTHATFSDAIGAVRRWLWVEWAFVTHGQIDTFTKLPPPLRKLLLNALAQAT
jgi:hypothetical protein